MKTAKEPKDRLDVANIQLGRELWAIRSGLTIYAVVGLNAEAIESGKHFFGFIQNQSLAAVTLGLAKVFEKEETHELCSIRGVYHLAKHAQIRNITAAEAFVGKYGISASGDWIRDVDEVFSRRRPRIRSHMGRINRVRHTQLAHIQQSAPVGNLPSIAVFEELLGFAFDFHSFVNSAFLNTTSHPILEDRQIQGSLLSLLKRIGVSDLVSAFKDI